MCGGFTCSKNALIALNILYVVSANTNNMKGKTTTVVQRQQQQQQIRKSNNE